MEKEALKSWLREIYDLSINQVLSEHPKFTDYSTSVTLNGDSIYIYFSKLGQVHGKFKVRLDDIASKIE